MLCCQKLEKKNLCEVVDFIYLLLNIGFLGEMGIYKFLCARDKNCK